MWISILNYNTGEIEVAVMAEFYLNTNNTDVDVTRNYCAKDNEPTHNVNCSITIK